MKSNLTIPLLCLLIAALSGCDPNSSPGSANKAFTDGEYAFVVTNRKGNKVIVSINGASPDRYSGTTVFKVVQDMVKDAEVFSLSGVSSLGAVAKLKGNERAVITVKVTGGDFTIE